MKTSKALIVLTLLLFTGIAQAQLSLPIKTISGKSFYYYEVKNNKESVYEIAHKMGVTKDQLIKYNPTAAEGIRKKQILFLPVEDFYPQSVTQSKKTATQASEIVTHRVVSGETVYGIAKSYGIDQEALVKANPGAATGLKEGDVIVIPLDMKAKADSPTQSAVPQPDGLLFHTVKQNESIYTIAQQFNTTVESLLTLNPGVTTGNLKTGEVIRVQPNTTTKITISRPIDQFIAYEAQDGDTWLTIAQKFNVTESQLIEANPQIKKIKRETIVYVPQKGIDTKVIPSSQATAQDLEFTYENKIDEVYNQVHKKTADGEVNIGMILPFQLHKAEPPMIALQYTEFYKGFVIAIDSVSRTSKKKINLSVYDTRNNLNVTDSILALPKLKNLDIIIAPTEPKQLERINKFGAANNVAIFNCFSSKNDDYLNNSNILQVNIPASLLASEVYDWFYSTFKDHNVVLLEDNSKDEKEIFEYLKRRIQESGMVYKTLSINNEISGKELSREMDPGNDYVFLPNSGSKQMLSNCIKSLKVAKTSRIDCSVTLVGYPEYVMYLNEYEKDFKLLDTYIFTRFFDPENEQSQAIKAKYQTLYDEDMLSTTPVMGLFGFDVGMYIASEVAKSGGITESTAHYKGIQSNFEFKRVSNWSGLVNQAFEILHYSEDGLNITVR